MQDVFAPVQTVARPVVQAGSSSPHAGRTVTSEEGGESFSDYVTADGRAPLVTFGEPVASSEEAAEKEAGTMAEEAEEAPVPPAPPDRSPETSEVLPEGEAAEPATALVGPYPQAPEVTSSQGDASRDTMDEVVETTGAAPRSVTTAMERFGQVTSGQNAVPQPGNLLAPPALAAPHSFQPSPSPKLREVSARIADTAEAMPFRTAQRDNSSGNRGEAAFVTASARAAPDPRAAPHPPVTTQSLQQTPTAEPVATAAHRELQIAYTEGPDGALAPGADARPMAEVTRISPAQAPPGSTPSQVVDIGQQIAARVFGGGPDGAKIPGQVEISLSPAELGRVRLSMAPGEAGLMVTIYAERPETLDLMRRHGDQLMQELRQAGFDRAEFTFGGDGADARKDRGEEHGRGEADDGPLAPPEPPAVRVRLSDGLDLRL